MKLLLLLFGAMAFGQTPAPAPSYVLGPDDQVAIHVLDLDEIGDSPFRIDMRGYINVPLAGRLHAAGLTVEQLETALASRLKEFLQTPVVTISVSEFRLQPVSVLGAVNTPGIHQVRGRKTLFEVIAEAGGLKNDAGNSIKITRHKEFGAIPLPAATADSSGEFSVAEVSLKSIMEARNPQENIQIQPNDVISVPRAELVYVIGAVKRAGGFVLSEREHISVLQALAMAEGLDRTAAPANAKILHSTGSANRTETTVDLKRVLGGKTNDLSLVANDILFVPTSAAKNIAVRTLEAAISVGTGLAIYHR
jgi:polysaccharide export outer membrane protein